MLVLGYIFTPLDAMRLSISLLRLYRLCHLEHDVTWTVSSEFLFDTKVVDDPEQMVLVNHHSLPREMTTIGVKP